MNGSEYVDTFKDSIKSKLKDFVVDSNEAWEAVFSEISECGFYIEAEKNKEIKNLEHQVEVYSNEVDVLQDYSDHFISFDEEGEIII